MIRWPLEVAAVSAVGKLLRAVEALADEDREGRATANNDS
jgi:hypothetical protein